MRFADRKTYTVAQDVENLLEAEGETTTRAAKRALRRAECWMYGSVGTDEHSHWIQVRNALAKLASV
jgi:hypothetical protein